MSDDYQIEQMWEVARGRVRRFDPVLDSFRHQIVFQIPALLFRRVVNAIQGLYGTFYIRSKARFALFLNKFTPRLQSPV